ncbi:GNAT family N-acetyltransferase [Streptomyces montanisoli]|uniref:GNAT family N-acetyltransferase n=1 Tax=Streptomyces montanisoli TaxID=2798581 RepID=A0A940MDV8_9ACTN|nr:GNAT family N-acetyltransferase [Streptomyces montanisoli]MBP0457782.1 GNAT family N-acetyltransferase [Streptomyces montanisoli]
MDDHDHPVRAAVTADAPRVAAVTDAAYRPYVARIGLAPVPMEADHAADIAAGRVFVTGRPVTGVLVIEPHEDHLLLASVAVHPDARGTGAGRALLEFTERRAAALGLHEVRLYTHALMTENQALYERIGYVRTGRATEGRYDRVHYRKAVAPPGS